MDQNKIDRSRQLTVAEALDIMNHRGAVTDGLFLYGTSTIHCLDGLEPNYVFVFTEFASYPSNFYSLKDFENICFNKELYRYRLPLAAEDAVAAMREGEVVRDIESNDGKIYFTGSIGHPYKGCQTYVFSCKEGNTGIALEGTIEWFLTERPGYWYEVVESDLAEEDTNDND